MTRLVAFLCLVFALAAQPAFAQAIAGQWQGILKDGRDLRIVLKVAEAPDGKFSVAVHSIDEFASPIANVSVTLEGRQFFFDVPALRGNYKGEVASDYRRIAGIWTQNAVPAPLELVKADAADAWATDPSPHKVSFVTTRDGVKLEVLDWGGTGKPLLFVPGLGADAHVFDKFAASLVGKYRVYGVTRRGYGASERPEPTATNYTADAQGDDVLQVMEALKLEKPVLAGWSIGGQELSSIGSRYPEKVSGLVYLDAGYAYSFYSPGNMLPPNTNLIIAANDIKAKVGRLSAPGVSPDQSLAMVEELLNTTVPQLQADLMAAQTVMRQLPKPTTPMPPPPPETQASRISRAIITGAQKHTTIDVPILAIFASAPPPPAAAADAARAGYALRQSAEATLVKGFREGLPHAKVIVIPNASHAVFTSHPEDVAREMTAFIDALK